MIAKCQNYVLSSFKCEALKPKRRYFLIKKCIVDLCVHLNQVFEAELMPYSMNLKEHLTIFHDKNKE